MSEVVGTVTMSDAQDLSESLQGRKSVNIVSAIAACIGSIGKLSKASLNQHQKYKFTSIDDFLAATGKACCEHGLIILQDELKREVIENNSSSWLSFEFSFLVVHESGEQFGPFKRSVAVPWHGAQSFGSAQSYALKQFMRSLFQIATGDQDDADYGPQSHTPPTLKTPKPAPISDDTESLLYELADFLDAFPSRVVFDSWILETANQNVSDMSEERGQKTFKWLKANQDPADWPESHRLALANAIAGVG